MQGYLITSNLYNEIIYSLKSAFFTITKPHWKKIRESLDSPFC